MTAAAPAPGPLGGDLSAFNGVAGVTAAYLLIYKSFLGLQVSARFKHTPKTKEGQLGFFHRYSYAGKPWWQLADRTVINTIEQAIPFLGGLWSHAIFVDPRVSAVLGGIYVASRFMYPILWASGGKFSNRMSFSTMPCYMASGGLLGSLLLKTIFGIDLVAKLSGYGMPVTVLALMGLGFVTTITAFFGIGSGLAKFTSSQFPAPEPGKEE